MTILNGTLYFAADDGSDGLELWRERRDRAGDRAGQEHQAGLRLLVADLPGRLQRDAVLLGRRRHERRRAVEERRDRAGTVLVKDIKPGAPGSASSFFTAAGGSLFFSADDGTHGAELWTTDGTGPGTALVADINPTAGSIPSELTDLNGTALFFSADDGTHGSEPWKLGLAAPSGCSLVGRRSRSRSSTGGAVTIGRSGSSFNVTGSGIGDPTCGGATVNNVDTVEVTGAGGNESLTIDLTDGQFAPGMTPEGTGVSEIEFQISLGAGSDSLTVQGGPAAEKITLGTSGVNLNGDNDADLTLAGIENVTVNGGDGNDTISAAGGGGTGNPFTTSVTLAGGNGNEKLTGGKGADVVDGGAGNDTFKEAKTPDGGDTLIGGAGTDTANYGARTAAVSVVLDGLANDGAGGEGDNVATDVEKLTGGKGGDTLDGGTVAVNNTIKGGKGNDTLFGRDGNDTLDTVDSVSGNDTADGGNGTDTCKSDVGDTKLNCEK